MSRPLCEDHENILRAINEANWDAGKNRGNSSLFKGPNTSVSRLAVTSKAEIMDIFRAELRCPVVCAGEINVGNLKQIGLLHESVITVEQDPIIPTNPAHAEIPQRITARKLAYAILDSLELHNMQL